MITAPLAKEQLQKFNFLKQPSFMEAV